MCELETGDSQCPRPSYRCVSYVTRLTHTAPKCTGPTFRLPQSAAVCCSHGAAAREGHVRRQPEKGSLGSLDGTHGWPSAGNIAGIVMQGI